MRAGQPGADVTDARGRTGLHLTGRDLNRNPDVVVREVELLCGGWHVLRRTMFDQRRADSTWSTQQRETYHRGDGAAVLLYDAEHGTVLLTRQFRWPVYVDGPPGSVTDRLHLFAAASSAVDPSGDGGGLAEEGEDIEVLELSFTEAPAQVRDGRIDDGKTVLLLQWAALWGPFGVATGT